MGLQISSIQEPAPTSVGTIDERRKRIDTGTILKVKAADKQKVNEMPNLFANTAPNPNDTEDTRKFLLKIHEQNIQCLI